MKDNQIEGVYPHYVCTRLGRLIVKVERYTYFPVGKIAQKAVCRSVLWQYGTVLQTVFFGDFAHWA